MNAMTVVASLVHVLALGALVSVPVLVRGHHFGSRTWTLGVVGGLLAVVSGVVLYPGSLVWGVTATAVGALLGVIVAWRVTLLKVPVLMIAVTAVVAVAMGVSAGVLLADGPEPSAVPFLYALALAASSCAASVMLAALFNSRPAPVVAIRGAAPLVVAALLVVSSAAAGLVSTPWSLVWPVASGLVAGVCVHLTRATSVPRVLPATVAVLGVAGMAEGAAVSSVGVVIAAGIGCGVALGVAQIASRAASVRGWSEAHPTVVDVTDAAVLLGTARRVSIVPGYSVASREAEAFVGELMAALRLRGTEVAVLAHPAAGRLPGHMTTLLLDAGIDPEAIIADGQTASAHLSGADVALVVGAPDVAVRSAPAAGLGTGYDVGLAQRVILVPGSKPPHTLGSDESALARRTVLVEGDVPLALQELGARVLGK